MNSKNIIFALAAFAMVAGCTKKVDTDEKKASYAFGYQVGKSFKNQKMPVDADVFQMGLKAALSGETPKLNEQEIQQAMMKSQEAGRAKEMEAAGENLKKSEAFLQGNKSKDGVKTTESGLQYRVISEGKGPKAKSSDTVVVHYKGTLIDGSEFDSSYKRNQPAEFPLKAVIPGWVEALQLMNKGAKYELFIPPQLAYKDSPRPGIPANSVLVFEVELQDIKK